MTSNTPSSPSSPSGPSDPTSSSKPWRTESDGLPALARREASKLWFKRALAAIPGGVNSPVRAFRSVHGEPIYFARAQGAEVTDVDGNGYIDFCMSWGPLILGHAEPKVVQTVQYAATLGLSYGACHPAEVQLAEMLVGGFPGMDMARLVSSGTEAVMTALRIARGATGRRIIVKFEGGYHGHSDGLLVKAGSGLVTGNEDISEATSAGIPADVAQTTLVLPFDDTAAVETLFAEFGADIAAVIIEPVPANNGLLVQDKSFLQDLRRITSAHGALLIFDEVISGFRLQYGGYGGLVKVEPDLVTLGKIVGGGMPIGAIIGPKALMELLAPVGPVYQAGTLSGNPVSVAAGLATLGQLDDSDVYEHLDFLGAHLHKRLLEADRPWPQLQRVGSICWPYFDEGPLPKTATAISPRHVERFNLIHGKLLDRGLYLAPSAYEMVFLSAAHTVAHIDRLADAILELSANLD